MRIKSIIINAFGNITDAEFDFSAGINTILQANGWGKSSMSDFIVAMLYGMDSTPANSARMGMRRRYLPYKEHGKYGGVITLEHCNKQYVIARNFDRQRARLDTLKFTDSLGDAVWLPEGTSPGEYLLNIDEDAFRRTVFFYDIDDATLPQATDSINRKLDVIVSDIDTDRLDNVLNRLDSQAKELLTGTKVRVNRGRINMYTERLDQLESQLSDLNALDHEIEDKYKHLSALQKELRRVDEKIDQYNIAERQLVVWSQIDECQKRLNYCKGIIDAGNTRYPNGVPSPEDVTLLHHLHMDIVAAESARNALAFNPKEEEKLVSLSKKFAKGIPSDADMAEITELTDSIRAKRRRMAEIADSIYTHSDAKERITVDKIDRKALHDYGFIAAEYAKLIENDKGEMYTNISKWSAVIMAVVLIVGIIVALIGHEILGYSLIALSAISFAVSLIQYFVKRNTIKSVKQRKVRLLSQLQPYFSNLGYYDRDFVRYCNTLTDKLTEYDTLESQANMLKSKLSAKLQQFGLTEGDVPSLPIDLNNLHRLQQEYAAFKRKIEGYNSKIEQTMAEASKVFDKYGLLFNSDLEESTKTFAEDQRRYNGAVQESLLINRQISNLKWENRLPDTRPDVSGIDIEALKKKGRSLSVEIQRVTDQISDNETLISKKPEVEEEITSINASIAAMRKRHDYLTKTIGYIRKADLAIKERYVGPIKSTYQRYISTLQPEMGDNIVMDNDYRVKVISGGVVHDCRHLSQGERTCLEFCLRIALIDNMFKDERPFLVLDDPFTELDAENFRRVSELLHAIVDDFSYQIIYLTCHPSRKL